MDTRVFTGNLQSAHTLLRSAGERPAAEAIMQEIMLDTRQLTKWETGEIKRALILIPQK